MRIALVGFAASRISLRTAGHVVVVICNMPRGVMVTERHADAGANRRHALYGNSEGNHQQEKKTLDLDHGAAESYHGPETSIRYRLFPDSVRPAEFPGAKCRTKNVTRRFRPFGRGWGWPI